MRSVRAAVGEIVDMLAPATIPADPVDPRVRSAVESLRLESNENMSLADIPARAGLSESRFAHLFRRDVGLPMRQYRLVLRMEEAFTQISLGLSLTEAAHAAGFSDYAQFCRICRRMFGSVPSCLPDFETEAAHPPSVESNREDRRRKYPACLLDGMPCQYLMGRANRRTFPNTVAFTRTFGRTNGKPDVAELSRRFGVRSVCQIFGDTQIRRGTNLICGRSAIPCSINLNIRAFCYRMNAPGVCLCCEPRRNSMPRKVGQIIARGDRRWLIRVYLGRDHETKRRNYHNRTIHGSLRDSRTY